MSGRLWVGTSGFAYEGWRGSFYPQGLPPRRMLRHYASVLPSVEINYTFRRLPSEAVVARWAADTPEGFRFTLKAHQRITHFKRLDGVGEDVAELIRLVTPLGERLGAVLFQLPPTLPFDAPRLQAFLDVLPTSAAGTALRYAMEFRHDSWGSPAVAELLGRRGVALCGSETDAAALEAVPVTAGHVYLRLRRERYSGRALSAWARRVRALLGEDRDVFCYFKHEDGGRGPVYAATLQSAVAGRRRAPRSLSGAACAS